MNMNFLKELEKYPHVIEYNPDGYRGGANFLVRLPGVGMKDPDMKHLGETRDILGFGVSREEAAEFIEAVRCGKEPETGFRDGLNALAVIEACYRSSQESRWVRLDELPAYDVSPVGT